MINIYRENRENDNFFSTYQSPFSWRYGSEEMRRVWSEKNKYRIWRRIWVALAEAQNEAGLVSKKELADLKKHEKDIDIKRSLELEKETKHDVVAAIKEFAEKCKVGGGKIHLGATSMDITDNADILRIKLSFDLIETKTAKLLKLFADKVKQYADLPCMGYTHLQPAEPTTVGYRLAFYAQDLLTDYQQLQFVNSHLQAKGMKGAVGTSASYSSILKGSNMSPEKMEKLVMDKLGLKPALITSQVYSRKIDFLILSCLAGIASSLAKFAGDLRILQSPNFGEWSEPFSAKQVGSSAMPFKKNPVSCENICSLARYVAALPNIALQNAAHSYLERTLDDFANRRVIIPEAFLVVDHIFTTAHKILSGLVINKQRIKHNLKKYAPFAATESILIEAVKNDADRQEMHELLRDLSLQAWQEIQQGNPKPLQQLLGENKKLTKYITTSKLQQLLNVERHIGDASERAVMLSLKIQDVIGKTRKVKK